MRIFDSMGFSYISLPILYANVVISMYEKKKHVKRLKAIEEITCRVIL